MKNKSKILLATLFGTIVFSTGFIICGILQPLGVGITYHSQLMQEESSNDDSTDCDCVIVESPEEILLIEERISEYGMELGHIHNWGNKHIGIKFYSFWPWFGERSIDNQMKLALKILNDYKSERSKSSR